MLSIRASRRILLALVVGLAFANCGRDLDPGEARTQLTGRYRLVLNSRPVDLQLDSSDLTLNADGTALQRCHFKNRPVEQVVGTWSFTAPRNVFFSRFIDCARVFAGPSQDGAASLIVEFSDPPVIVLNPDIVGVFYERLR